MKLKLTICSIVALSVTSQPLGATVIVVPQSDCNCSSTSSGLSETCRGGTCDGGKTNCPADCSVCCEGTTCTTNSSLEATIGIVNSSHTVTPDQGSLHRSKSASLGATKSLRWEWNASRRDFFDELTYVPLDNVEVDTVIEDSPFLQNHLSPEQRTELSYLLSTLFIALAQPDEESYVSTIESLRPLRTDLNGSNANESYKSIAGQPLPEGTTVETAMSFFFDRCGDGRPRDISFADPSGVVFCAALWQQGEKPAWEYSPSSWEDVYGWKWYWARASTPLVDFTMPTSWPEDELDVHGEVLLLDIETVVATQTGVKVPISIATFWHSENGQWVVSTIRDQSGQKPRWSY